MNLNNMKRTLAWLTICIVALSAPGAFAGDNLKLHAKLIWGCDDDMPTDPGIKPVSPEVATQLKGIFKWKHYYVVTNMTAKIPDKGAQKLVLSKKCTVEVKNDAHTYKAKLFGEGKLLKEVDQKKVAGENLVLAGGDKNATAWFVILTPQE